MQIKSDTLFQHKMIDLRVIHKRLSSGNPSRSLIPVLVPMFLIISSSVYPAIMSSMENREMKIISNVIAKLNEKNIETSNNNHRSTMPMPSSEELVPSSPTPIDPIFSATSSSDTQEKSSDNPSTIEQQQEGDNKMVANVINPGEQVHTVWTDQSPGDFDIFYKRDGSDYDPTTENLNNNAGFNSLDPAIAVAGTNVHIVWAENNEILYQRSITGGATFDPVINLSNNGATSTQPSIAISGNSVHVVWTDNTPTNFDIFYRRSINGGANFEATKNISDNTGGSFSPEIVVSGSSVHVVWDDATTTSGLSDIFYRRSPNNGAAFHPIKNLSGNAANSFFASVAVSGSNVHVVWQDHTSGLSDILYRRSLDNGNTFPNVIKNLSGNAGSSGVPSIAASGSNVHVVWQDNTSGTSDILYRRSLDNGNTFPNVIKNLSGTSVGTDSQSPDVTTSGSNVYVVWSHLPGVGDTEIAYRTSSNNGNTFPSDLTNLSANDGNSFTPQIAAS
jgi:hypothetical protein